MIYAATSAACLAAFLLMGAALSGTAKCKKGRLGCGGKHCASGKSIGKNHFAKPLNDEL